MKESDQVKLSRYIDSELSPLERKGVEAALQSDPTARRVASEYALIRQYVKDLPREPLGTDLVPAVQAALSRKRWSLALPTKSPAIAGIMAASVLIASFSVAGYLAMHGKSIAPASIPPGSQANPSSVRQDSTASLDNPTSKISKSATAPIAEADKPVEAINEPVHPQIAMAPAPPSGGIPAASPIPPAQLSMRTAQAKMPEPLKDRFSEYLKATSSIDRLHSFRLHVSSISDRQTASILSLIGQYRASASPVIERKIPKSGNIPDSLAYVALIPTSQINEFRKALQKLPGVELERDKPDDQALHNAKLNQDFRLVDDKVIDRAIASTGGVEPELSTPQPGPSKKTELPEEVADAISQPLQVKEEAKSAKGTLDQVLIWIRTDPLAVESDERKPSRTPPAKK